MSTYLFQAAICWAAITVRGSVVVNGGFEQPTIPFDTILITQTIPGWTSTVGSGIEIQNHRIAFNAGSPFEGNQHVELDSFDSSNMFQDLATIPGTAYELTFAYSPRPGISTTPYGGDAVSNRIDVLWEGVLIASLDRTGAGLIETAWEVVSFSNLPSSDESTRLEFRDTGTSDSFGGYIDDVRVVVVPEPSITLLLICGVVVARLGRRR